MSKKVVFHTKGFQEKMPDNFDQIKTELEKTLKECFDQHKLDLDIIEVEIHKIIHNQNNAVYDCKISIQSLGFVSKDQGKDYIGILRDLTNKAIAYVRKEKAKLTQ